MPKGSALSFFCEKWICAEVQAFHRSFRTVGVEKVENKRQIIKQGGFFRLFCRVFPLWNVENYVQSGENFY